MRNRAKFRGNRSRHDRHIPIFRISKWQPSAILDFLKFKILTINRVMRVNVRHRAKISWQSVKPLLRYGHFDFFSKWRPSDIIDF